MSEHRTFSVCQGCGAWKETGSGVQSLWADYDMMFFIKHHGIRCPVTGEPSALMYISDGDPDFHPLALEKQWTPKSCRDYRPSQIPKFTRYMNDIEGRLAGLWHTNNVGGHSDETLVLWPDGRAAIDFYNIDFCGRDCFRWRLDGHEHICFEGLETYFRSGRVYFEVGCLMNRLGEEADMLRIHDGGPDAVYIRFFKSRKSLSEYRIPED